MAGDRRLETGLIQLATVARAPFLPTLVQLATGEVAMGDGVMVLLIVTSVASPALVWI